MKRSLIAVVLLFCISFSLFACAEQSTDETDKPEEHITQRDEAEETITLTLGQYGSTIYPQVTKFNASQNKYIIEVIDYSQNDELSFNDEVIKLNADLVTGNGPDIIYFGRFRL